MIRTKRVLDITLTIIGLVIFAPVIIIAAIMILVCDGKPVFYRQERIGYMGSAFRIWKLRTMQNKAELYGGQITIGADPRVTRIGKVLRKMKIDELPQFINVLLGEMSLVGPRPEVAKYVNLYTPEQRKVLDIMPGITDPASIKYRNESKILAQTIDSEEKYINEIMPDKIKTNIEYAEKATIWTDMRIIARTIMLLIKDYSIQKENTTMKKNKRTAI